mmetsp:Transcript_8769/g.26973  ORF Transcript_8769/g.26973 Transcript_8769/m.26973 type:complete len:205 (+) Transcript_8769:1340-1954(+)
MFVELAPVQFDEGVGDVAGEGAVVRHEDDESRRQRRQILFEPAHAPHVHVVRGLVAQEDVGLRGDGGRESDALALAAGQIGESSVDEVLDAELFARVSQVVLEAPRAVALRRLQRALVPLVRVCRVQISESFRRGRLVPVVERPARRRFRRSVLQSFLLDQHNARVLAHAARAAIQELLLRENLQKRRLAAPVVALDAHALAFF